MRRLVIGVVALAAIVGGTALALAPHSAKARIALPDARTGKLQVIAFTQARPSSAARGSLSAHLGSLSAISPAWLALGPAGTISYRASDAFARGLTARGAGLLPVLRDPEHRIRSLLAFSSVRKRSALRLAVMLRALGAQGLVLDLGPVPAVDRASLPSFVRDLRAALPPGARILVVIPPITDRASRRRAAGYDLRDLSRPAMLVLRAWAPRPSSEGPRPIASLAWYKKTLRYTLAHAPRSRVIVALPTWGAVWSASGVAQRTQAELFRLAKPEALLQPSGTRISRPDETAYVESDRSLQLKLEVARAAHVAGVALWVRGGESAGVWREPLIATR
jgi:spore germination protein YaaH